MPRNSGQPLTPPPVEDLGTGLVTKSDIARLCKVSNRTIEAWVRQKRIPFIRLGHRQLRFDPHAVMGAIRKWTIKEVQ